jgi:HEPN domain-containing protein
MERSVAAQYPGETTTSTELLQLADEYRVAAQALEKLGRAGVPFSRSPYRLNAIHAIELYLNALLLHAGHDGGWIRGLSHDLAARAELAVQYGLTLRRRTQAHLQTLADTREYLVSRYAPERSAGLSQLNRLSATLDEIAVKVGAIVRSPMRTGKLARP